MSIIEVVLLGIGLAMDAFAVSICKGLEGGSLKIKYILSCGLWFGGFQALMPLIGFAIASVFAEHIAMITPYISFALLLFLGAKMIYEGIKEKLESNKAAKEKENQVKVENGQQSSDTEHTSLVDSKSKAYSFKAMIILALATSIDALAVGITFAFNGVSYSIMQLSNIWLFIGIIGVITFIIASAGNTVGSLAGKAFGEKFGFLAQIIGGVILIGLGVKFLIFR